MTLPAFIDLSKRFGSVPWGHGRAARSLSAAPLKSRKHLTAGAFPRRACSPLPARSRWWSVRNRPSTRSSVWACTLIDDASVSAKPVHRRHWISLKTMHDGPTSSETDDSCSPVILWIQANDKHYNPLGRLFDDVHRPGIERLPFRGAESRGWTGVQSTDQSGPSLMHPKYKRDLTKYRSRLQQTHTNGTS